MENSKILERKNKLLEELEKANKEQVSLERQLEEIKSVTQRIIGAITVCEEFINANKEAENESK